MQNVVNRFKLFYETNFAFFAVADIPIDTKPLFEVAYGLITKLSNNTVIEPFSSSSSCVNAGYS